MFGLTAHKNSKSQNIKILLKTNKKALECGNVDIQESMFVYALNTWSGAHFVRITASVWCGM